MGEKSGPVKESAEQIVKEIRRATRRQFSAEEKIRIVPSGLLGEDSIADLCRREGIGVAEGRTQGGRRRPSFAMSGAGSRCRGLIRGANSSMLCCWRTKKNRRARG